MSATEGPDADGRGRRLGRRVLIVLSSATLSVALLGVLFGWLALNAEWRVPPPEELTGPTEIRARDGTLLARFTAEVDRRVVTLDQVSKVARDAVVASEDARFYEHEGVDLLALGRAVISNVATGGITQGGSTLTQQYVKNAFVGTDRTVIRKVREAVISIQLERDLSKQEILERYLNRVYFGEGAYGIETAALTYFGKSAKELTAAEGATLAQLLPAPSARNPRADPDGAEERRDRVLETMGRLGMLRASEVQAAQSEPLEVRPRQGTSVFHAPYFVKYVRLQLEHAYGAQAVMTGALTVTTSLDLAAQEELEKAVAEQLPPMEGENADVDAGAAAVDPKTGQILAMYGGRSFENQQFNNATQLHVRQAGSGFKPFVYVAALEQGKEPTDVYPAPSSIRPQDCPPNPDGSNPFNQSVQNAGGAGYGSVTLKQGLANSINTVFVQLGCDVGPKTVVETARLMGVRNVIEPVANISIGSGPTGPSPLDMASAFGTLANDGRSCPARAVLKVLTREGEPRELPDEITTVPGMDPQPRELTEEELESRPEGLEELDEGRCHQVIDPNVARHTTQALELVVDRTTGTRAQIGRPQAGKTGTTNDEKDAWFNGYTPNLAMSVWVGHTNSDQPLRNVAGFRKVQGGTVPALIWKDAAEDMLAEVQPEDFLEPGELNRDDSVVGPARPRPAPETAGQPDSPDDAEVTPTAPPSEEPTGGATPTSPDGGDGGSGSDPGSDGGSDGGSGSGDEDEDDDCFLVVGDCD